MAQKVQLKRSSVVTNGAPKLPDPSSLEIGEIAINFAKDYETLSIKNSESGITTFSSDERILANIPTEANLEGSGFTKNAITGLTINGSAATVNNGAATIDVSSLPPVTAADNGKILSVVNGQWSAATPLMVYSGNSEPNNILGRNGDIYLQTSN